MDRLLHDEAIAPGLRTLEITNILIESERRGRTSPEETDAFLSNLARLPIGIRHDADERVLLALARKHQLTTYDASDVELPRVPGPPSPCSAAGWPVRLAPRISRSLASSRTRYGAGTRFSPAGRHAPRLRSAGACPRRR